MASDMDGTRQGWPVTGSQTSAVPVPAGRDDDAAPGAPTESPNVRFVAKN